MYNAVCSCFFVGYWWWSLLIWKYKKSLSEGFYDEWLDIYIYLDRCNLFQLGLFFGAKLRLILALDRNLLEKMKMTLMCKHLFIPKSVVWIELCSFLIKFICLLRFILSAYIAERNPICILDKVFVRWLLSNYLNSLVKIAYWTIQVDDPQFHIDHNDLHGLKWLCI